MEDQRTRTPGQVLLLTRLGRKHLEKEAANWELLSNAISSVVWLREV
jgi:hypothetical protein